MILINIAICDDEKDVCNEVETYVNEILEEKSIKYEIDIYYNSENLCQEMKRTMYDLIFLDIELPGQEKEVSI